MMVRLLEEPEREENWEEHAKYMMSAMYGGGADTVRAHFLFIRRIPNQPPSVIERCWNLRVL